jgi:hypothetical protein
LANVARSREEHFWLRAKISSSIFRPWDMLGDISAPDIQIALESSAEIACLVTLVGKLSWWEQALAD